VEKRLIPPNAILDLATPHGVNRSVLADEGYQVAGLEVPCVTSLGNVVIDVALAQPQTGHLIACEAKCGANIEEDQARRYEVLEARTVVSGAFVTLRERVTPRLEVLYVALAGEADRIIYGLNKAEIPFAVLVVYPDKLTLENVHHASDEIQRMFSNSIDLLGEIARNIPFDHESDLVHIQPYVNAAMVAALARRAPMISSETLAEQAAPQYPLYGTRAQGQLRRRVGEAARHIAAADPENFEYHPAAGNHDSFVKLLRTPEDNDPRGRTQAYQKLARTRQRRRPAPQVPGQTSLLDELEEADNEGRSITDGDDETGGTS
jgi:hypothetical protein